MIGVVIPAHNEEDSLDACLRAVQHAAGHVLLAGEPVEVVVVLDSCTDATAALAARAGVATVECNLRNVGAARAAGADYLIARDARWLAFTDADTCVDPAWIVAQLACEADAVCGVVAVDDWSPFGPAAMLLKHSFDSTYQDRDGHRHVHGANLGVCARVYRAAGGFGPNTCHEDVALVEALKELGASIAWSAAARVVTSARRVGRAPHGFAGALLALHAGLPGT